MQFISEYESAYDCMIQFYIKQASPPPPILVTMTQMLKSYNDILYLNFLNINTNLIKCIQFSCTCMYDEDNSLDWQYYYNNHNIVLRSRFSVQLKMNLNIKYISLYLFLYMIQNVDTNICHAMTCTRKKVR